MYRIVDATCKFCHTPLRLKLHEEYSVSDPLKIIQMAACNRCADLRDRRRVLHLRFASVCSGISNLVDRSTSTMTDAQRKEVQEAMTKAHDNIEHLVKLYLRLIGDWYNRDDLVFEEIMVPPFMQAPHDLSKHIARLWRSVPQHQPQLLT